MNKRKILRSLFREWFNDYLTIQQFADDHNMTRDRAYRALDIGRKLHNKRADQLQHELTTIGQVLIKGHRATN